MEADKAQVAVSYLLLFFSTFKLKLCLNSVHVLLLQVLSVFKKVFAEDFEPHLGSRQFHITPLNLQVSFHI